MQAYVRTAAGAAGLVLAVLCLASRPAAAELVVSRGADCHFSAAAPPAPGHLADWERSAHGQHQVGCEKCHGGDPTTFESFRAHQGLLNSREPGSPVHRRNITATCGACHAGPFVAFQQSQHFQRLAKADDQAPTCTTCHDAVAAELLSPKALERQCDRCHGTGKVAPRPGRAASARRVLEDVRELRASLDALKHVITRVPKGDRRTALDDALDQATVPLVQAVHDSHAFVFDSALERLAVARQRIDALTSQVAR